MRKRGSLVRMGLFCAVACLIAIAFIMGTSGPVMAQEKFELDISTLPAGFASYIMGVAMAEQINKNSTWLHATAMEGRGPAEHMKTLVKKAEKRKNYLFFNTPWDVWEANHGWGAYKNFPFDYSEFRFVCILVLCVDFWKCRCLPLSAKGPCPELVEGLKIIVIGCRPLQAIVNGCKLLQGRKSVSGYIITT